MTPKNFRHQKKMNDAKGIEITELEIIKEISVAEMNYILEKRR